MLEVTSELAQNESFRVVPEMSDCFARLVYSRHTLFRRHPSLGKSCTNWTNIISEARRSLYTNSIAEEVKHRSRASLSASRFVLPIKPYFLIRDEENNGSPYTMSGKMGVSSELMRLAGQRQDVTEHLPNIWRAPTTRNVMTLSTS